MGFFLGNLKGTDEKAIIGVVTSCSNAQRQRILVDFKTMFGKVREDKVDSNSVHRKSVRDSALPGHMLRFSSVL